MGEMPRCSDATWPALHRHESFDDLAFQRVEISNRRCFGHCRMRYQYAFHSTVPIR
jgi:hypothetical protein